MGEKNETPTFSVIYFFWMSVAFPRHSGNKESGYSCFQFFFSILMWLGNYIQFNIKSAFEWYQTRQNGSSYSLIPLIPKERLLNEVERQYVFWIHVFPTKETFQLHISFRLNDKSRMPTYTHTSLTHSPNPHKHKNKPIVLILLL